VSSLKGTAAYARGGCRKTGAGGAQPRPV